MSYFEDRFRNHAVHTTIGSCLTAIKSHELENLSAEEVIAINRCEHVVKFAATMLKRCDSDLINPIMLSQLNDSVVGMLSQWNQYTQNRTWNSLTTPTDNILTVIATLSSKQRPIPKSYSNLLGSLRDESDKMLGQIHGASEQQNKEISQFGSRLADFAKILETHESQVEAQKGRIDSLITQQQEAFSQAQDDRTEKFSVFISERKSEFDESQVGYESQFESLYEENNQAGQEKIDSLKKHLEHAKEIIGIIGNIGVTGNYQKIANQEKAIANIFRWIAVGCFGAMLIAVITVLIVSFFTENFSWEMALFRVVTAAIFAAPGVYCAMESSKHRHKEQENRKLELELASISPFLEKLNDPAAAQEILKKLAPEYFGNHKVNEEGTPLVNIDSKSVREALKPILELIKLVK